MLRNNFKNLSKIFKNVFSENAKQQLSKNASSLRQARFFFYVSKKVETIHVSKPSSPTYTCTYYIKARISKKSKLKLTYSNLCYLLGQKINILRQSFWHTYNAVLIDNRFVYTIHQTIFQKTSSTIENSTVK